MTTVLAVVGPSPLWYMTRGTGLVAIVLLTATLTLGIVTDRRWSRPAWPRFATTVLHRNLSLLCVAFLAVHILTAELDVFAPVGVPAVLIPFASAYRPIWLGLGTVAFDLLIALIVTSLLRERIGFQWWRTIHWAAYLSWPVALIHGLGTGSDSRLHWVDLLYAACTAVVLAALAVRLAAGWERRPGVRLAAAGITVIGLALTGHWALRGPLAPGWARKAGTPPSLLLHSAAGTTAGATGAGASASGSSGTGTSTAPAGALPASFTDQFSGQVGHQQGPTTTTVTIVGPLTGTQPGTLTITLIGVPDQGGVALQSGQLQLRLPSGTLAGPVSGLDGDLVTATVSGSSAQYNVTVHLSLAGDGTGASGVVSVARGGGQ